jgi:hypothetical protein
MLKSLIVCVCAGLALSLCLSDTVWPMATAQSADGGTLHPAPVTSDTLEYCTGLARELTQVRDAPQETRDLTVEGERMCRHGYIVGGILRLRRAMAALRAGASP